MLALIAAQASEQRAAKQPEASSSVSNVALQAMQSDLQHQVCIPSIPTATSPAAIGNAKAKQRTAENLR